jgi:hypothetical protein
MPRLLKFVLGVTFAAVLAAPDAVSAKGGGGHGGSHGGGHRGGSHSGHRHAHGSAFIGAGAFYAGMYSFYPGPYSYYYNPIWSGIDPSARVVYVEQFAGTPTPDSKDSIYCPERASHYPYVTDCPGGWQRIFSMEQAARQAPAP